MRRFFCFYFSPAFNSLGECLVTPIPLLKGVWAKIERANEHIHNLNSEINSLVSGDTYRLVSELNNEATECVFRVTGPEPPLRLSTIVGDAAHHLRSSLDLLVTSLVAKNGNTPSKNHQFPICDSPQAFKSALSKGQLEGVSADAKLSIEAFQPYSNGKDIKTNFLYVLRELNNADKHRALIVANAQFVFPTIGLELDRDITLADMSPPKGPQTPTQEGIEVAKLYFGEPQPGIKISGKPTISIVFSDSGVMPNEPVVYVLKQISEMTLKLIEVFEKLEFNSSA